MATLSFRQPAANRLQDRPARPAPWARGASASARQSPSHRGLQAVVEVLELQPPTGPSVIALSAARGGKPACDDAAATGWFDSTWELQQGLDISEGLPADLPLGDWLQIYLAP